VDDLLQEVPDIVLVVVRLVFLWGFGLGPGSDVTRSSPSRGEKLSLRVGAFEVRFGLVPHFALGPITNVPSSTSSGRDFLVVGVNDVDGWLDIGGSELLNAVETVPSNRTRGREFRNDISSVTGLVTVSTPPTFLALAVLRPTGSRRWTHVASTTPAERNDGFATAGEGAIFCRHER